MEKIVARNEEKCNQALKPQKEEIKWWNRGEEKEREKKKRISQLNEIEKKKRKYKSKGRNWERKKTKDSPIRRKNRLEIVVPG